MLAWVFRLLARGKEILGVLMPANELLRALLSVGSRMYVCMYVCSSSNLFSNIKVARDDHKKIWDTLFRRPKLGGNHYQ